MKKEYDFSRMKSRKNPYASKLKKPVTIRLSEDVIEYFKQMAEESGVPYQSLRSSLAVLDLQYSERCL